MKYFLPFLAFFLILHPAFAQDPNAKPSMRSYMGTTEPKKEAPVKLAREPNVEIWLPPEFQASEQKWPLLIFSHGFGGCAKQSKFLNQYLADHGYIVIAPDHEDANCDRFAQGGLRSTLQAMRPGKAMRPERPFRSPEMWNDKTEIDRKEDVLFALSSMLDDRQYKNYVDTERMGLIGHSLGGYTVLGLAGAWPAWKDKRFKAVLALSPFAGPYYAPRGLGKINIPVMYQGGTKDMDITPNLKKTGYPQTKTPKYFVELDGAGHFAWTELETSYQGIINQTALAFFDTYVKGQKTVILPEGIKTPKIKTFWKDEGGSEAVKP